MKEILSWFEQFTPEGEGEEVATVTLPLLLRLTGSFLVLRAEKKEDRLSVWTAEELFCDANGDEESYFRIFEKHGEGKHFGMECREGRIGREYPAEASLNAIFDECIRFFRLFDDFFIENGVIGREEEWE